ncbi:hypothetical protein [Pseudomonas aeruginosa]|uniref:hypothetical protein n=1 Tax=Pseudomonas aeruginosa TaxID=287 RepID=UPI0012FDD746
MNKIGLNIAQPYDVTRHSAVIVRRAEEIVTNDFLVLPEFYARPGPAPSTVGGLRCCALISTISNACCGPFATVAGMLRCRSTLPVCSAIWRACFVMAISMTPCISAWMRC